MIFSHSDFLFSFLYVSFSHFSPGRFFLLVSRVSLVFWISPFVFICQDITTSHFLVEAATQDLPTIEFVTSFSYCASCIWAPFLASSHSAVVYILVYISASLTEVIFLGEQQLLMKLHMHTNSMPCNS